MGGEVRDSGTQAAREVTSKRKISVQLCALCGKIIMPTQPRIPSTKTSITDLEIPYATDVAARGWRERCHEYIRLNQMEKL